MSVKRIFGRIELEVNSQCNMSPPCPYCPNSKYSRMEKGDMELELFELIINQLVDMNYQGVLSFHFYGEPLLSPNIKFFVEQSRAKLPKARLTMYTNGLLLTKEKLVELTNAGVDMWTVTRHVGVEDYSFDEVYKGIGNKWKSKNSYKSYKDLKLTNRGGSLEKFRIPDIKLPLDLPCYIPSLSVVITLKGNVLACYEDYHQTNVMGNVQEKHLKDIWNSEKYREFRYKLSKKKRAEFPLCKMCDNALIIP